jgi:hypothetical protein
MNVIDLDEKYEKELEIVQEEILNYDIFENWRDWLIDLLKQKSMLLFKLRRY